jgi:hypothetical protein
MPLNGSEKRPAGDVPSSQPPRKKQPGDKDGAKRPVLLNVHMVTQAGELNLAHCVTVDGELFPDDKSLSNIRRILIKKKALTLSRYEQLFPSQRDLICPLTR